jgi:hypothetical protein
VLICAGPGHTVRAVANEWNRQGLRTRGGGLWTNQYVGLQLTREGAVNDAAWWTRVPQLPVFVTFLRYTRWDAR